MSENGTRVPWGIYVISAIYALGALALGWVYLNGTPTGRLFATILGPICAAFSIGIALRINFVRIVLVVFLALAIVGDGILLVYFASVLLGLTAGPANKEPLPEFYHTAERLTATTVMFLYLIRSDVRQAFRGGKPAVSPSELPSQSSGE